MLYLHRLFLAAIIAAFTSAGLLFADESGPRAYKNVPVGIHVLQLYYLPLLAAHWRGAQVSLYD